MTILHREHPLSGPAKTEGVYYWTDLPSNDSGGDNPSPNAIASGSYFDQYTRGVDRPKVRHKTLKETMGSLAISTGLFGANIGVFAADYPHKTALAVAATTVLGSLNLRTIGRTFASAKETFVAGPLRDRKFARLARKANTYDITAIMPELSQMVNSAYYEISNPDDADNNNNEALSPEDLYKIIDEVISTEPHLFYLLSQDLTAEEGEKIDLEYYQAGMHTIRKIVEQKIRVFISNQESQLYLERLAKESERQRTLGLKQGREASIGLIAEQRTGLSPKHLAELSELAKPSNQLTAKPD